MARLSKLFAKILHSPWLAGLALFIAAFAIYSPALSGEFIWDDGYLVGDNPFFKSPIFVLEVFRKYLFLDSFSLYYRPVQNLSYMLDYWLWNQNSFGYHVSNVIFHASSGLLLYFLLSRLFRQLLPDHATRSRSAAFLVAWIWVIHPIHNAAVAYISGRADSLASLFALSAWLLWLRSAELKTAPARVAAISGALFLTLMALCSKEIAFVWIALFGFYLAAFDHKSTWKHKGLVYAALAGVLLTYVCLRHLPGARFAPPGEAAAPIQVRFILMLRALGDYVGLLFFPVHLQMERTIFLPGFYQSESAWASHIGYEYLSLIGGLTLLALAYFSCRKTPGQKLRILGATWFVLGFLPISNLFPLNAQCAEHWIYMPSIGFMIFMAGCLLALPVRLQSYSAILVCCASVFLGARTYQRSDDWSGVEKFLTRTISSGGGTCRIHANLAAERLKRGDFASAESLLRDTIRRFPEYIPARISLGMTLMREGKKEEAEQYLNFNKEDADKVAHSYPNTWQAALNLAHMREQAGRKDEALKVLNDATALYPEIWELIRYKATLLTDSARLAEAIALVKTYTAAHWWNCDATMVLAHLQIKAGANDEAIAAFQQAGRLDIHGVEAFSDMARLELGLKKPELAYESQRIAVKRDPNRPTQYLLLSVILDELGRKSEAEAAMRKAESLRGTAAKS